MKNNMKGITLIALIITIIILLILAVVTIGEIKKSEIILYAKNIANKYLIAQEEEKINLALNEWKTQSLIPENTISFKDAIYNALKEQNCITEGDDNGPLTITFNKTGNKYVVDSKGNLTNLQGNGSGNVNIHGEFGVSVGMNNNETIIINVTVPESWDDRAFTEKEAVAFIGKNMFETDEITTLEQLDQEMYNMLIEIEDEENPLNGFEYADTFGTLQSNIGVKIGKLDASAQEIFAYLAVLFFGEQLPVEEIVSLMYEYEPTTYSFKIRKDGGEWIDITGDNWRYLMYKLNENGVYEVQVELDDKTAISEPIEIVDTNLGEYAVYDIDGDGDVKDETILWRVLRNDKNKVELITADALGSVDLGYTTVHDSSILGNPDYAKQFNEARIKYNNAIDLMVEECKRVTGITENIRNVGGPATDPTTMNDTIDFSELETFSPTVPIEEFNKYEGIENGIKKTAEEEKFLEDYNQMEKTRTTLADNSKSYYVASRIILNMYDDEIKFGVRYGYALNSWSGSMWTEFLFIIHGNGNAYGLKLEPIHAVRPVFELEAGALGAAKQLGTKENPIEIYQAK